MVLGLVHPLERKARGLQTQVVLAFVEPQLRVQTSQQV
jgi:hypothetical protein